MENSAQLDEKSVGTTCIPPGACCKQRVGMIFPPWTTIKGRKRKRPITPGYVSIYAIVNLVLGKAYVGRTSASPYVRFQQHMNDKDQLGRALKADPSKFVVLLLEKVPVEMSQLERGTVVVNGDFTSLSKARD